ncbi:MAG: hypothetical protein R2854_03995 [Caldilineaceae bacterium]
MGAKVTFGCGVGTGIDVNGVIGAGLHARLAADATGRIKFDDTVSWYIAVTGQMRTQGGLAQWLQRVTWKWRVTSG